MRGSFNFLAVLALAIASYIAWAVIFAGIGWALAHWPAVLSL